MDELEHQAMLREDETHWWYQGRRRILGAVLSRDLPRQTGRPLRLMDAGCGSGRTMDDLGALGSVAGVDISERAVAGARSRGHGDVHCAAIEALPFPDASFDVVTCLDVIEHTPDDRGSLRELLRVTRPGGTLIVTVPAHPRLWSHHDVVNRHYRRYGRTALVGASTDAGWRVVRDTYFNSLTLLPAAGVRRWQRLRPPDPARSDLDRTPRLLNGVLVAPLLAEAAVIGAGARVPLGLSLLAVLRRPAPRRSAATVPTRPTARSEPLRAAA